MSKFIVRLTNEFSTITGASSRSRAGITVPVGGEGITVDLTDEQLKEIRDDQYLTLTPVKEVKKTDATTEKAADAADAAPTKSATTKA